MENIDEFYNTIGKNIKKVRLNAHETQEEFAEKLDMSRGFISQLESPNLNVGVSLDTLFIICQKYNVDIKTFFDNNE